MCVCVCPQSSWRASRSWWRPHRHHPDQEVPPPPRSKSDWPDWRRAAVAPPPALWPRCRSPYRSRCRSHTWVRLNEASVCSVCRFNGKMSFYADDTDFYNNIDSSFTADVLCTSGLQLCVFDSWICFSVSLRFFSSSQRQWNHHSEHRSPADLRDPACKLNTQFIVWIHFVKPAVSSSIQSF